MNRSHTLVKFLLLLAVIAGALSTNIYLPSLAAMGKNLDADYIELVVSLYLLGYSTAQLFFGPLSDKIGRRPVALLGLIIGVVGALGSALTDNFVVLLTCRFIHGVGMAACYTLMRSALRDVFQGVALAKAFSHISLFLALIPAVAPVMGGYLEEWLGWRSNFFVVAGYIVIVFISFMLFFSETNHQLNPKALRFKIVIQNYYILLRNRTFMGYTLLSSFTLGSITGFVTSAPILFEEGLKLSPVTTGWLMMSVAATLVCSRIINAFFIARLGVPRMIYSCLILMVLGSTVMNVLALLDYFTVWSLLGPMLIFVLGAGNVMPNAVAGAFNPFSHMAGSAAALYGCMQIASGFLVSFSMALLNEHSKLLLSSIIVLLTFGCIYCFKFLISAKNKRIYQKSVEGLEVATYNSLGLIDKRD